MLLRPRLGFIFACIFLDALGIGLIIPVLPHLIGTLTETHDMQTGWYGAIMLSYGLMQFASSPFLGALSDRVGRRPVLLGGIFGLGVMFIIPAITSSLTAVLASRLFGGMLSANTAVAQAYIADLTRGYERAAGFGKIGAIYGAGFVIGPALGGFLGAEDPRIPFFVASAVTLLNFLYGFFVLPESLHSRALGTPSLKINNPLTCFARLSRNIEMRYLLLTLLFCGLANGILQYSWALYSEFRYGFTPREIGLSIFGLGLGIALMQGWVLQHLLLYVSAARIALAAIFLGASSLAAVGLSPTGALAIVFFCTCAASSVVNPILTGAVSRRTPVHLQGETIGAVSSVNSLTGAVAPAFSTPLLMLSCTPDSSAPTGLAFLCAALLSGLAFLVFAIFSAKTAQHAIADESLDD